MSLLAILLVAGCGQAEKQSQVANDFGPAAAETATDDPDTMPVRIGELGPSFAACNAAGTTRNLKAGETLAVHAAPFDAAAGAGAIPSGSRFFVCTRSLDERWMGIVWNDGGRLDDSCGVSSPVAARRAYGGPCRSGWVASAFVSLAAG